MEQLLLDILRLCKTFTPLPSQLLSLTGECRGLIQATLHLVNREFDALADDFVVLGLLPPGSDKAEIAPALTGVFQDALANGVNNLNFGDLSGSLGQTMYQYNFQIPPYYTLLVRSLSVLEVKVTLASFLMLCLPVLVSPVPITLGASIFFNAAGIACRSTTALCCQCLDPDVLCTPAGLQTCFCRHTAYLVAILHYAVQRAAMSCFKPQ